MPRIQVFGERNSATNYVIELIESNFDVEMLRGVDPARFSLASQRLPWAARELASDAYFAATRTAFKHTRLTETTVARLERCDVGVVNVVKHPLSWALSTFRRPYHRREHAESLTEFVTTPWKTVGREQLGRRTMANAFELWAVKASAAQHFAETGRIELWRFEDVLADEPGHLARISERLGQPTPAAVVGVPENTKAVHGVTESHDQIRDLYLNERWRAEVNDEVRECADLWCGDIARRLNYEI